MPMHLDVLVPFELVATHDDVSRIVAETSAGAYGLWPRRQDCVLLLVPGILVFETDAEGETYFAVDVGVLIKTGLDVRVSVRRAVPGDDLSELRGSVVRDFSALDEEEQAARAVRARLETGFLRRLASFRNE